MRFILKKKHDLLFLYELMFTLHENQRELVR